MNTRISEGTASSQRICKEVAEVKLILRSDCGDWSASHDGLGSSAYQGISTEQGETLALVVAHTPSLWREPNLDHGRRIVAAWNACDGIHTEVLEGIPGVMKATVPYHELKAQRDELLKALKKCAAVCAGETVNKNGLIDALESARAAIANTKGQP